MASPRRYRGHAKVPGSFRRWEEDAENVRCGENEYYYGNWAGVGCTYAERDRRRFGCAINRRLGRHIPECEEGRGPGPAWEVSRAYVPPGSDGISPRRRRTSLSPRLSRSRLYDALGPTDETDTITDTLGRRSPFYRRYRRA